jgi:hypothetical protein
MTVTATAKAMLVQTTKDDEVDVMTTTTTTLMTTTTNKTTKNNDDANLLGAQMRAHTQGRFSCCALVHLFHNNILVKSCVVIDKSKRAREISWFIPPWRSSFTQRQGHLLAGPRLRSFALQRGARAGRGRLDTEGWGATKCV